MSDKKIKKEDLLALRDELGKETVNSAKNRVKKSHHTLGGFAITQNGRLTRSKFFDFLDYDLDYYDDIVLTEKEAYKLKAHITRTSTGTTSMTPMMCGGALCPFADRCPLVQMKNNPDPDKRGHPKHGKAPVGKQCIIEMQLLKEWIMKYMEEYDVDPSNLTEVGYINELADLMILEMRANMMLSKKENASLLMDQTVGVDKEGDPIVQTNISPFLEVKEKVANRRSKIIKLMVGDRQEKYKKEAALKIKLEKDPSNQMSELRSKLEELQKELNNVNVNAQLDEGRGQAKQLPGKTTPEDLIDSDD